MEDATLTWDRRLQNRGINKEKQRQTWNRERGRERGLTINDDINGHEADLAPHHDPTLAHVRAFIALPDAPDLQVVVIQDLISHWTGNKQCRKTAG